MNLVCPHCRNPVDVTEATSRRDIACATCGGSFQLEHETIRWSAPIREKLGRFVLLETVGIGGFGTVFKARDTELDRTVAIKVPRGRSLPEAHELDRFLREARSVAQLQHPSIVTVHEVGQCGDVPYLVSDFVEGVTLADLLSARRPSAHDSARLIGSLAEALQYAHERGVIHRDIKPSNIMLEPKAGTERGADLLDTPRIMDFGLAKREAGETTVTTDGQVLGTPAYMSPEQARGEAHTVDGRTDVYSLGVILYQLLTGELPFRGTPRMLLHQVMHDEPRPPRKLNDQVPRDLETICLKAMAKEAGRRYPTAGELAADLRQFLGGEPIRARPIGKVERLWRWCWRNRSVAALLLVSGALLLCLVVGTSLAAVLWRQQRDAALANLERAELAEKDRSEKLWGAYMARARAARWSGRAGRRHDSLDAVGKAAELLPHLDLPNEERAARRLDLRNEAIASLALVDLQAAKPWPGYPAGSTVLTFAPGLERYARSNDRGDITIRSVPDDREITALPGSGIPALALKFSPDGRLLGVKYHQDAVSMLQVWNIASGKVVLDRLEGINHYAFDFSPDSRALAVGLIDGSIAVVDIAADKEVGLGRGPAPHSLAFHPDGTQVAVSSLQSSVVLVREVASGKAILNLKHASPVRGMAWRRDGRLLATACSDGRVYVWSVGPPLRLQATLEGHRHVAVHVAFSHRGDLLGSTSWDNTIRLWEPLTGRQLVSTPGLAWDLRFSPDDRRLAPALNGSQLGYWEVARAPEFRTLYLGAGKKSGFADFSPDGRLLACVSADGTQFWDLQADEEVASLDAGNASTTFHPDGKSLFTSGDGGLWRWPIAAAKVGWQIGPGEPLSRRRHGLADLSRQGRFLVSEAGSKAVGFDLARPGMPILFEGQANPRYVAVSPDGQWVATGTWHGSGVKVWAADSGQPVHELPARGSASVGFSPDGKWLFTSTGEDYCCWQTGTWQLRYKGLRDRGGDIPAFMGFSPGSELLAITHSLSLPHLLDPATGAQIATLEPPHPTNINSLRFHPDGSMLAATTENLVHLWDLRRIRQQLGAMRLDWDLPSYGAAPQPDVAVTPLKVTVEDALPE